MRMALGYSSHKSSNARRIPGRLEGSSPSRFSRARMRRLTWSSGRAAGHAQARTTA
jgi:hypothetical protein